MADIQRDKGHNKITYAGSLETVLVSVVKEGSINWKFDSNLGKVLKGCSMKS